MRNKITACYKDIIFVWEK